MAVSFILRGSYGIDCIISFVDGGVVCAVTGACSFWGRHKEVRS